VELAPRPPRRQVGSAPNQTSEKVYGRPGNCVIRTLPAARDRAGIFPLNKKRGTAIRLWHSGRRSGTAPFARSGRGRASTVHSVPYRPETYLPVKIPGFGLIIAFLALTALDFFTANLVGRTLVEFGERLLGRMPIVRPIYRGLKQVFETLFSKSGSTFRTVGLVEFSAPGMWWLVFLSTPPGSDITVHLPSQRRNTPRSSCRARRIPRPDSSFTSRAAK
jgi:Protein of unknown function (DUF502)